MSIFSPRAARLLVERRQSMMWGPTPVESLAEVRAGDWPVRQEERARVLSRTGHPVMLTRASGELSLVTAQG